MENSFGNISMITTPNDVVVIKARNIIKDGLGISIQEVIAYMKEGYFIDGDYVRIRDKEIFLQELKDRG
jgi:hypothetical protein